MEPIDELLNFSLINIDKPTGPTSYSISEFVKRELKLKKTSHMGTLDPKVTGVLPITLGRACKLAGYFITHDKTYVGVLHTHKIQNIKELQELINKNLVGKIKQTPPHRSAVKREERIREVYYWKLLESDETSQNFVFETKVQGGTYIRKLCSDLGEIIDGAHMEDLRRISAGIFNEEKIYTLFELEKAVEELKSGNENPLREMLIPAEIAIKKVLPLIEVNEKAIKGLMIGRPLFTDQITKNNSDIKEGDNFSAFCKDRFLGIYRRTNEEIIFGRSEFVFN